MTDSTKSTRFLPRYKAVKKAFPNVCPHERTMEQRIADEKQLRREINAARCKRRLTELQSAAMLYLVEEGNWETGILEWSNAKWCESLGIKNRKTPKLRKTGGYKTDQSPFALRQLFRSLIARRLIERERLKSHDSTVLLEGTPAWGHGIWITRRIVWDGVSLVESLDRFDCTHGPDPQRSGPDPLHRDRVPTRSHGIGSLLNPSLFSFFYEEGELHLSDLPL